MVTVRHFLVKAGQGLSLEGLRAIPHVLDVLAVGDVPSGSEALSQRDKLAGQRRIIHAHRDELRRFLSQRRLRCIPGGNGDLRRLELAPVPARPRFRRVPPPN
jgi:hypothetical protein